MKVSELTDAILKNEWYKKNLSESMPVVRKQNYVAFNYIDRDGVKTQTGRLCNFGNENWKTKSKSVWECFYGERNFRENYDTFIVFSNELDAISFNIHYKTKNAVAIGFSVGCKNAVSRIEDILKGKRILFYIERNVSFPLPNHDDFKLLVNEYGFSRYVDMHDVYNEIGENPSWQNSAEQTCNEDLNKVNIAAFINNVIALCDNDIRNLKRLNLRDVAKKYGVYARPKWAFSIFDFSYPVNVSHVDEFNMVCHLRGDESSPYKEKYKEMLEEEEPVLFNEQEEDVQETQPRIEGNECHSVGWRQESIDSANKSNRMLMELREAMNNLIKVKYECEELIDIGYDVKVPKSIVREHLSHSLVEKFDAYRDFIDEILSD